MLNMILIIDGRKLRFFSLYMPYKNGGVKITTELSSYSFNGVDISIRVVFNATVLTVCMWAI